MPDHTTLKIGQRLRLLRVPEGDLRQRERELRQGVEDAGWTANTIERILHQNPVVVIDAIDEYGLAWFSYDPECADGTTELHTITIMDDESWELA